MSVILITLVILCVSMIRVSFFGEISGILPWTEKDFFIAPVIKPIRSSFHLQLTGWAKEVVDICRIALSVVMVGNFYNLTNNFTYEGLFNQLMLGALVAVLAMIEKDGDSRLEISAFLLTVFLVSFDLRSYVGSGLGSLALLAYPSAILAYQLIIQPIRSSLPLVERGPFVEKEEPPAKQKAEEPKKPVISQQAAPAKPTITPAPEPSKSMTFPMVNAVADEEETAEVPVSETVGDDPVLAMLKAIGWNSRKGDPKENFMKVLGGQLEGVSGDEMEVFVDNLAAVFHNSTDKPTDFTGLRKLAKSLVGATT